MKGTYLAAALILLVGYLAIRLADANMQPKLKQYVLTGYLNGQKVLEVFSEKGQLPNFEKGKIFGPITMDKIYVEEMKND